jgi:hypothetical protein
MVGTGNTAISRAHRNNDAATCLTGDATCEVGKSISLIVNTTYAMSAQKVGWVKKISEELIQSLALISRIPYR